MASRKKPGSVFQRTSDGRWMGVLQAGFNTNGKRRVITVSSAKPGDAGKAEVNRKLDRLIADIARNGTPSGGRVTVKTWADEWLQRQVIKLRPNSYSAALGAVNNWIVPTIGTRRLDDLRPADVRAVHQAMRDAGLKPSSRPAPTRR
jgi:hypothetical protein